jgi:3-deoxy-manno-octulosonate cytidylyltransferase (CMP-KDO synthetase)
LTGTDRLVELKKRNMVEGDVWVNWQADEPFISERIIMDLLQSCEKDGADIWTLKKRFQDANKAAAPDICKVVCDEDDFALYFSRCPIPFYRTGKEKIYYKHIGLYAYSDKALEEISCLSPCEIELAESLEQLRFLFYGMKIKVHETQEETIGIDVPEHLVKAQEFLKNEQNKGKII